MKENGIHDATSHRVYASPRPDAIGKPCVFSILVRFTLRARKTSRSLEGRLKDWMNRAAQRALQKIVRDVAYSIHYAGSSPSRRRAVTEVTVTEPHRALAESHRSRLELPLAGRIFFSLIESLTRPVAPAFSSRSCSLFFYQVTEGYTAYFNHSRNICCVNVGTNARFQQRLTWFVGTPRSFTHSGETRFRRSRGLAVRH